MAKELSILQQQAEAITKEVNKGANTSSRIGGMFSDMLDYNEEKRTELETQIDKRTTEYNVSVNNPTSGTDGSNKYDLAGAIAQVPAEYRTIQGLKVTFVNESGDTESWEYKGDSWVVANFSEIDAKTLAVLQNKPTPFSNIAMFGTNTGGSGIEKDEAYDVVKAIYLNGVPSDKNYFLSGVSISVH